MEIVKDGPTFDPKKQYRWTPETEFVLNGGDFATLLNTLRAHLSTEQAQITLLAQTAAMALEEQLKLAVESGRAVEVNPEDLPQGMQVVK
jgi:hypothetical protein